MSEEHDPWRQAWDKVRADRVADEPRRAAGRAAFEAVRPLKGRPESEVREALVEELAQREITNLTSVQLDLLVEAVSTSPTRTAVRLFGSQMRSLATMWRELKAHVTPRWTTTPSRIADYAWRDDQEVHRAAVHLAASSQELVQRVYREVPLIENQDDEQAARVFDCWISIGSSPQDTDTLTVHTGEHLIGTLAEEDTRVMRSVLNTQKTKAIGLTATAWGDSPEHAIVTVGLPGLP